MVKEAHSHNGAGCAQPEPLTHEPGRAALVRMELQHIPQVHVIEQACFGEPWSPELFIRELQAQQAINLVALVRGPRGDSVAGYLCAWVLAGECSLHKIACLAACRRTGIATKLLHECVRLARREGAEEISLEVREHNAGACALYDRNGFVRAGVRKGYYGDTREDALIMVRRLGAPECAERRRHG